MKKLVSIALLAAALAVAIPAHADEPVQGNVLVPAPKLPVQGLVTRHARCAYLLGGEASQGIFGQVVSIDPSLATGESAFALTGAAGSDWDVVFYSNLGTCDNTTAAVTVGDQYANVGDEAGTIPEGATSAIIVFAHVGVDQAFAFTA